MLPIIQGYAEGKTVERRRKDMGFAPWDEVDIVLDGFFDLQHYEYRVKPEEGATQDSLEGKDKKIRTIKFKAKRQDNEQWVTGDLAHSLDGKLNILGFVEEDGILLGFTGAYPIVPDTICQFIGFIDRNRKEIYEGDLLWDRSINGCFYKKSTGYCGVVVWNSHEAYYEL